LHPIQRFGAELSEASGVTVEAGGDISVRQRFERDAGVQPGRDGRRDLSPWLFRRRAQGRCPL
jgi:hypothetical protein